MNNRSLFAHTRRAVVYLLALAALFGGHETAEAATPLSSDATLSSLSMSPGTFNQDFAPGTIAYFATVENAVSQITVTAETNNGSATIEYLDGDNNELTDADEITDDFQVTLVVGITQVRVKVTAPDEMTTKTYVIIITRAAATSVTDATLSRLSLSAGSSLSLTPVFSSSTTIYTATVGNTVSQIVVHGTRNNTSASVAYLDGSDNTLTDADEYTNGFQVNLVVGPNTIKVKVTASDETTMQTYTVTVTRAASTDATLSGLSLSAGTLAPVFASGTTIYTAAVRNAVSQMTVTATKNHEAAAIAYLDGSDNTLTDEDGNITGLQVNLVVGPNTIKVKVTAEDGTTTKTYTVTVTRVATSVTDATLSGLSLSAGTLDPVFASSKTGYMAAVGNTVSQITVTAETNNGSATIAYLDGSDNTLTDADGNTDGLQVNLVTGDNSIKVKVTASDGMTTLVYTVTITRAVSTDATLSDLSISPGTLKFTFGFYFATVENAVSQITVTATKNNEAATIAYLDGSDNTLTDVDENNIGLQVNLLVATNTIKVKVTAEDGTTKTYTLLVIRRRSSDATLSSLSLSAGTLTPVPHLTGNYTAAVGNAVSQITVTATKNNDAAAVAYLDVNDNTLTDADGNTTGLQVNLVVGANKIKVKVTAQDGVTTQTYTITVTRAATSVADVMLSGLSLSEGTLNPIFSVSTTNYTATVGNAVSQITVTTTKNNGAATLVYLDENDNELTDADGNIDGFQVNLVVGPNTIKVKVQDGVTTQICIIIVTRAASSDATSSVQTQEISHHVHTMTHGHDDYVDHTHSESHRHMITLNTGETMEQARQRHLGMWHEENQPNGRSVMYNHNGVGRLAAVSSDEVDDMFANDPADPQIRILHNHSFEHDDGQGYMHLHHYVHGHASPNPNEDCPGMVVCEHEHANHAQQFREHGNHVIGEKHVHFWVIGEEGSSHVVQHRDRHLHILSHTHTNGYSVEIGGVLTDTKHYHRFTHNHSYTDTPHDYSEGGGLPRGISLPVLIRKIGSNGFRQEGEHNHNSVSFGIEADDTGGSEMSDAAIVGQAIPLSVDFNGNGVVDFPDFLLFVAVFGSRYDKEKYEIKYDLNVNGEIEFGDFLLFVESFGKTVNRQ